MFDRIPWRILVGAGLILAGLFSLLDVLDILDVGSLGWALLFLGGGAAFLYVLAVNRSTYWWAAIPGFALLGLGLTIGVEELAPRLSDVLGGMFFLGSLALAFWIVYILNRSFWWAVIPAGVLTTLALVAGAEGLLGDSRADWVFFLGLAATFGILSLLPVNGGQRMSWPLWPAGALLVLAIFLMFDAFDLAGVVIPVI
ncbi:MAG TPA: hypothetical protein VFF68_09390, partial [Anaerolineaceae bacterium]|nr:hypothetical protein [Anaerolineaceae bacterium]